MQITSGYGSFSECTKFLVGMSDYNYFLKTHCVAKLAVLVRTCDYKCVSDECFDYLTTLALQLIVHRYGTWFFVTREGHRCTGAAENDLTRIHGHKRKEYENGENYMIRSFITCISNR
jgi:hypothetical protein